MTMTTDQRALLAAVIADPESDAPRLIYADYLEENGQSEHAEFIRCDIAKLSDPYCERFHDRKGCSCNWCRSAQLEQRVGKLVKYGIPGDVASLIWRGFVHKVSGYALDWFGVRRHVINYNNLNDNRYGSGSHSTIVVNQYYEWTDCGNGPCIVRHHPIDHVLVSEIIHPREYSTGNDRWSIYRAEVPPRFWDILCPDSRPPHEDQFLEEHSLPLLENKVSAALIRWAKEENYDGSREGGLLNVEETD